MFNQSIESRRGLPFKVGMPFVATMLFAFSAACGGGGGCSGCDAITMQPFPEAKYGETFAEAGAVKITESGFTQLNNVLPSLIGGLAGGGGSSSSNEIEICLGETDAGLGTTICDEPKEAAPQCTTSDSKKGCAVKLDVNGVNFSASDSGGAPGALGVDAEVKLGGKIPISIPAGICFLHIYKKGQSKGSAATVKMKVPINLAVDNDPASLHKVLISAQKPVVDLSDVKLELEPRTLLSTAACGLVGAFEGAIKNSLKDKLPLGMITDKFCQSCQADSDCGSDYTCDGADTSVTPPVSGVCRKKSDPKVCQPLSISLEAQINAKAQLGIIDTPNPLVDLVVAAADRAPTTATPNRSLTIALRAGASPQEYAWCAPNADVKRPKPSGLAESANLNSGINPKDGSDFQIGVALNHKTIDEILWSFWAGGNLCIGVGSQNILMGDTPADKKPLTSKLFSLLAPSINDLTSTEAPIRIRTRSNEPPTATIGPNDLDKTEEDDGNGGKITKYSVEKGKGLVNIHVEKFDLEISVFAKNVWIPLFNIVFDLDIPVGINVTDDGKLEPVFGDIPKLLQDAKIEIKNNNILAEDDTKIASAIPTVLNMAGGMLGGDALSSLSQELPEFMGLKIGLTKESFAGLDEITPSTDPKTYESLGVFLKLEKAAAHGGGLTNVKFPVEMRVRDMQLHNDSDDTSEFPFVTANVDFMSESLRGLATLPSNTPIEYRYRVQDGAWSNYFTTTSSNIRIDSPFFALGGGFEVEVQARYPNLAKTQSVANVVLTPNFKSSYLTRTQAALNEEAEQSEREATVETRQAEIAKDKSASTDEKKDDTAKDDGCGGCAQTGTEGLVNTTLLLMAGGLYLAASRRRRRRLLRQAA